MAIVGSNALLNQYVPTFYIKDLRDGQTVIYDSIRKAFVNSYGGGGGGINRLSQLLDVSPSVGNPIALQPNQVLMYNDVTMQWENSFVDYTTLINTPTSADYSFSQLSDVDHVITPGGYVKWDSTGTQVTYTTTIDAVDIVGLADVAISGDYNDLINTPSVATVTSVSVLSSNGIISAVTDPTTTPEILLTLGNITPLSLTTTGTISGANFSGTASGTNTGDQTIILVGDVAGTGTGEIITTLATVNAAPQVDSFRKITVNSKGLVTATTPVTSVDITTRLGFVPYNSTNPMGYTNNTGTVTSVAASGINGVTVTGPAITQSGQFVIGLGDIRPTSIVTTGAISGSNVSGTNTGDQVINLMGDVIGTGTGAFITTLATVNAAPQVDSFRKITVNSKGLVTATTPVTSVDITTRLGFVPYNSTNPMGYTNNTGTVTYVAASGANGILVTGGPVTAVGTLAFTLGNITPLSVVSSGTITGANLSGINTGDETAITIKTKLGISTLSGVNTGDETAITIKTKLGISTLSGVNTGDETNTTLLTKLGISTLSGVNTGDQTIVLIGDVTGSGTGAITTTLCDSGVIAGTYTNANIIVDSKGRVISASNGTAGTGTIVTSSGTTVTSGGKIVTVRGGGTGGTVGTGGGTVTSVRLTGGTTGLTVTGTPITTSGTMVLGGQLSIAHGGTGASSASGAVNALLPAQHGKGGHALITDGYGVYWAQTGTVTSVSAVGTNGISVVGSPITGSGTLTIKLGDITPRTVTSTGSITGSNLTGVNTGDQIITLTGDVTGTGTGVFATTLAQVNNAPGTYGDSRIMPTISVNAKGLVTQITTQHVDTSTRDLIDQLDTLVVAPRHQYIVTSRLEVLGRIENNGRIAVL